MKTAKKWDIIISRAQQEYNEFIHNVEKLPSKEVIDRAYEIAIKTEIISLLKDNEFDDSVAEGLLSFHYPLSTIYNEWITNSLSSNENLIITIEDCARDYYSIQFDEELEQ